MAGPLSAGSYNVGRDLTLSAVINGQTFSTFGLVTDTNRHVMSHLHEVIPTNNDGIPVFRVTYSGFESEFHITRQNGQLEYLIDSLVNNYYAGGTPPIVSALETIRNPDNSVDQWQYTGGVVIPENLGSFKGADPVNDQTVKIRFAQRAQVGGAVSAFAAALTPSNSL